MRGMKAEGMPTGAHAEPAGEDAADTTKCPRAVEWLPVLTSSKHFFQPCAK